MMKLLAVIVFLPLISCEFLNLNEKLASEFSKMTSYEILDQKYKEIKNNKSNPSTKTQTLSELFIRKLQILQKTIKTVETRMKTYVPPELDESETMWARDLKNRNKNNSLCEMQKRGSYTDPICLKKSAIQIPIDIFQGDKEMLKTVSWTSVMDKVWLENVAAHPDLLWQYFGSTSGLLRFYPGANWPNRSRDKEDEPVDLYDVRRRSWFVQGMSLPKDMLILIDSSGSSQGQALALMKHITRSLLETLNENDQINIVTFPQDVNEMYRAPCFETFVKATFRNKQVAINYTRNIASNGIANFSKALDASFTLFENVTSNISEGFSGSHCNQMIMLLTDGGNEKPRDVLRKFNSFQKIRIFTYLIGPISTDAPAIKWIAEKSRGQFYQIPSIVAIRSQTQDYIRYLSESKANLTNVFTWTGASLDYLNDELVVSVTAPLFNKTKGQKESNDTILGVLGIDVPVRQFFASLPYDLGEYGYFFIINSQGFVLYHPRLLSMREEFLGVDILDLETDDNMEGIRRKMIDGESGELSVDDYDDMLDEHHINIKRRTYHYEPIHGTEFSLCVVLYDEVKEGIKDLKTFVNFDVWNNLTFYGTDVIFNNKIFCSIVEKDNMTKFDHLTEIEVFAELIKDFECDVEKLKSLVFDIIQSSSTGDSWMEGDVEDGVMLKFIKTSNIFRTFPENSTDDRDSLLANYHVYEERILKSQQWFVTVFNKDTEVDNLTAKVLLIVRRVTNGNMTLAVIGGLVHEQWLQNIIFEELTDGNTTTSYLLDDGGIIISTSLVQPYGIEYIGSFFGENSIEGEVMTDMIINGIYKRHRSTGYLASCKDLDTTAFSPRLQFFLPFLEVLSPKWWMTVLMTQLSGLASIFQVLMSVFETVVYGDVIFYEPKDERLDQYCAKEFYKYTFADKSNDVHSHEITCGNCTKTYKTEMLPDLNSLLVSITSEDDCKCPTSLEHLEFKPQPIENEAHLTASFYRKYVPCMPFFSEEEETYSSSDLQSPTSGLIGISLLLLLLYYNVINNHIII